MCPLRNSGAGEENEGPAGRADERTLGLMMAGAAA
jgi:hypothetical protein